jgi:sulfatase modifying factor 1
VTVKGFRIAAHAVSNDDFAAFVAAIGYLTIVEREGWSFVFAGLLPDDFPPTRAVVAAPWKVPGAAWLRPEGSDCDLDDRGDHPSSTFPGWMPALTAGGPVAGCPTRSNGSTRHAVGWRVRGSRGDELTPGGEHRMNVFRGRFPGYDTGEDGFVGTAPADAFPPIGHGLHNTTGNVWEWCGNRFGSSRPGQRTMRGGSYLCHSS